MNINKKTIICNLFSDFILSKIGLDSNTKIQVTDCNNFYVINGETNSSIILNMNDLIDEFNIQFANVVGDDRILRTIDLINYSTKLIPVSKLKYKLYNSENCLYPKEDIEPPVESYIYTSTFPHGHSFTMGRSLIYKMKNIAYNVFNLGYIKWLEMEINLNNSEDDMVSIKHNLSPIKYDFIQSAILDVFDVKNNNVYINKYDIFKESIRYQKERPKIYKIDEDFIVI